MFTSVIGTLTSLLPKYFIFGSYVPVLIFSFVNLGLVYLFSAWSRFEIEYWFGKSPTMTIAVAFVATVVTAYVVSAINDFLREFLEGRHFMPEPLANAMRKEQEHHRAELQLKYATARSRRFELSVLVHKWECDLRDARPGTSTGYVASPLTKLRVAMIRADLDGVDNRGFKRLLRYMERAVNDMKTALQTFDHTVDYALESDRRDLVLLLGAVLNAATQVEYENGSKLFTYFGNDPVAPTRMGNIAAAIQAYTIGRYKMELTVFFSRLQSVLIKNEDKGYNAVLDAKAQLDFLVASCWFSGVTTLCWVVALAALGEDFVGYVLIAVLGLLLTAAFYVLAGESYRSYAEVVRACVDVNRFKLLAALDVALPGSLRGERRLWSTMSYLAYSGGDNVEFSYEHPHA